MIFDSLELDEDQVHRRVVAWPLLRTPRAPPTAILCSGVGSRLVADLLGSGDWRLVPIPDAVDIALQHPTLRAMRIEPDDYPDAALGEAGIQTVGTTAFLAARLDTPSELVTAALEVIYDGDDSISALIPQERAAEWQGLAFHPAARRFFDRAQVD